MNFINPPAEAPQNMIHRTYYSQLLNHEIGYNIYLPPDYEENNEKYPVAYHLHGWQCDESSDIWALERVFKNRRAVTVFPNYTPVIEAYENLPVEHVLIDEFIPYIEKEYRLDTAREGRSLSGMSMGGGMAFCFAIRHPGVFSSVTAYAGTYHHYFHKGCRTVGAAPEKALELYKEMLREQRDREEGNVLCLVRQNAEQIRGILDVNIHIGTADILFCDNEIMHLYLDSLQIPHKYVVFDGAAHDLSNIL